MKRPRYIRPGDNRSPMMRLLQDCNVRGTIEVSYEAQWRTLFKAQRLGLLDDRQQLTDKGRAAIAKAEGVS